MSKPMERLDTAIAVAYIIASIGLVVRVWWPW